MLEENFSSHNRSNERHSDVEQVDAKQLTKKNKKTKQHPLNRLQRQCKVCNLNLKNTKIPASVANSEEALSSISAFESFTATF